MKTTITTDVGKRFFSYGQVRAMTYAYARGYHDARMGKAITCPFEDDVGKKWYMEGYAEGGRDFLEIDNNQPAE